MWSHIKLTIWFILWIPCWIVTFPFKKPTEDNCYTWALRKWEEQDGYLVIRWCRHSKYESIKWPHFMWLPLEDNSVVQHLVPENDDHENHLFPRPWFEGHEIKGDDEDIVEN